MKNELMQMPVNDMMTMAKTFAESGLFETTKQAAQAFVKIQAGAELGIAPFAAMSGIHIIKGKPAIGAGLMASKVKGSGKYDYEVKEHTDKICSIDFYQGKKLLGNSTFTIEDARKAGTQNIERFPKNMLFARAISNGVKFYTPDIFTTAVYVPEEMESSVSTEDVTPTEVSTSPASKPALQPGTKKYNDTVEKLRNCTVTVETVKQYFTLSPDVEEVLTTIERTAQSEIAHEQTAA